MLILMLKQPIFHHPNPNLLLILSGRCPIISAELHQPHYLRWPQSLRFALTRSISSSLVNFESAVRLRYEDLRVSKTCFPPDAMHYLANNGVIEEYLQPSTTVVVPFQSKYLGL
jgi:hypothetical protein